MSHSRAILSVLGGLALAWSGCLGFIDVVDDARPPAATGGGGAGGGGGQGGGDCSAPAKAYCSDPADCACSVCQPAAGCQPDGRGCIANGLCLVEFEDSCVCADCDFSLYCLVTCNDDGVCDVAHEGCGCADCAAEPSCADNGASCAGGLADGVCDAAAEGCACPDCMGDYACHCVDDGVCGSTEPCACPDCDNTYYCIEACDLDGYCRALDEGCGCADCAAEEPCADNPTLCLGGAPDGNCTPGESCSCNDCLAADKCLCENDGVCDNAGGEPCTCADCDGDIFACAGCLLDGACDLQREGCGCGDCAATKLCADNLLACAGQMADGSCGATEGCLCPDCMFARYDCLCADDGSCGLTEACPCADCVGESYCQGCSTGGECDLYTEGCGCPDCTEHPVCQMK